METTKWYAALDTHSCGQPLRIITGGCLRSMAPLSMRSLYFSNGISIPPESCCWLNREGIVR